jgi:hypothetical protein
MVILCLSYFLTTVISISIMQHQSLKSNAQFHCIQNSTVSRDFRRFYKISRESVQNIKLFYNELQKNTILFQNFFHSIVVLCTQLWMRWYFLFSPKYIHSLTWCRIQNPTPRHYIFTRFYEISRNIFINNNTSENVLFNCGLDDSWSISHFHVST